MKNLVFHVVGLPHTYTSKEFLTCAFTQKILNFCKMMKSLGHTVYHYGGELSTAECDEHITLISEAERQGYFGGVDTKKHFYPIKWDPTEEYWMKLNGRAIVEIKKRAEKTDFVCVIAGNCNTILEKSLDNMVVEFGIGYEGSFAKYRVFESYAWMHYTYGKIDRSDNGRFMDAVIPNYWDLNDFSKITKKWDEEPYLFFIGRMIERKGVSTAVMVADKLRMKIKLAGQGLEKVGEHEYVGSGLHLNSPNIEYMGSVGVEERANLLANAQVTLVPTTYLEPFGGVVIESMLAGTPVVTTDFGAFPELVTEGFNGYRFRTLGEAISATKEAMDLNRGEIKEWARNNFSIDRVRYQYQAYFEQLLEMWDKGWYSELSTSREYDRYKRI